MVASSSNLMLLATTHVGNHMHVRKNSTIPNAHDDLLQIDPPMNRGVMIRSNSNTNIRGSTGNLKDRIRLETVMAPTPTAATYPNKNGGGFSMASNNSSSKKKNRCMSGGNLKNLLYVLEPLTTPSLPVITSASASTSAADDWFLGDEEEEDIISDDEEEEDSITPITIETTIRPADTIIAIPSTPGRKPSPSPRPIPQKKEEKKSASIRMETRKRKETTIRVPIIENRASFRASSSSSSSSSSTMGSSNLKDIMLETAALASASVSSLRSSRSTSTSTSSPSPAPVPVPAPAPTLNTTWSTNTSMEALTSMHRFFSIPLSAPTMPDIFSCGTTGTTATSFDHQKVKKDFTKKMSSSCTTRSTPIQQKKNHHEQDAVNVQLGTRLYEVKNDLFFQLNLPASSSQKEEEEECSGRTAATASSTCLSSPEKQEEEEEEEEESFFERETTKLSPRIMMFYQDDDDDDDDDDDILMMMAPLSASRLSFYNQEQEEEEVTPDVNHNTPTPASNLSLLTNIALSLASPVISNDTKEDDHDNDDDDAYGIFLSFSDDEKEEHTYNHECVSSPSLQYNDYVFHNSKTAPPFFGVTTAVAGRNSRQQWTE